MAEVKRIAQRMRVRERRGWGAVALAGVSLPLAFSIALEAGARLTGVRYHAIHMPRSSDERLYCYDATKGWFHVPGALGQSYLGGPDDGRVRINSLGLRGPEVAPRKPRGTRRVLVFGDSFVFGVGVDESHLFSTHLERLLNSKGPAREYEVVNMGVSGYSTDQELILLQELGPGLEPDAVVVVICDNDFPGNVEDFSYQRYYKPYFELRDDGSLTLRGSPTPRLGRLEQVKLWLGEHSAAWNLVRNRQANGAPLQHVLGLFQVGVPRSAAPDVQVATTFALVRAFRDEAARLGASLLVTNTAHAGEAAELHRALRPKLTASGIGWLALEESLARARKAEPDREWEFPRNWHWNRDAHRLVAERVATALGEAPFGRPERLAPSSW